MHFNEIFQGLIICMPSLDLFPSRRICTMSLFSFSLDTIRGHVSNFILSSSSPSFLGLSSGILDFSLILTFILLVIPRRI